MARCVAAALLPPSRVPRPAAEPVPDGTVKNTEAVQHVTLGGGRLRRALTTLRLTQITSRGVLYYAFTVLSVRHRGPDRSRPRGDYASGDMGVGQSAGGSCSAEMTGSGFRHIALA